MTDINQIWIDQEASSGKNVVKKRIDSVQGLNCFIGLIGATGARMFQLEIDFATPVHKNFLRKFSGVVIQAIPFNQSHIEFTIILLENEMADIFTMFIEDIVEKLAVVEDSQKALTLINHRVNYWKKLFSKATGELLSAEKQRGLFGELFFLRLLLHHAIDKKGVMCSWKGAESANQDFTVNTNTLEIKTTKANNPSIHISNEQQLDFTSWENLYLGIITVTETSGVRNSLASIIEEIKELVNHDVDLIRDFETKLELTGITKDMLEHYDEISYSVNNRRYFRIKDGFPMILKCNLPNEAIYNVKYQIDISGCMTFEVLEEELLKTMI